MPDNAKFCSECGVKKEKTIDSKVSRSAGICEMTWETIVNTEKGFWGNKLPNSLKVEIYIKITDANTDKTIEKHSLFSGVFRKNALLSNPGFEYYIPFAVGDLRIWGEDMRIKYTSIIAKIQSNGWNINNIVPQEESIYLGKFSIALKKGDQEDGLLKKAVYRYAISK